MAMTKDKKKVVTDDDLYRQSSQFRLWSFTKDEFVKKQRETYEHARDRTLKTLQEKGIHDFEPLTFQEERDLVRFYASKIGDIAGIFYMPSQVKATAISYFMKFYLVNSVMDYHPKNIMYTCVFFASKSENYFVTIKDFCSKIKGTDPQEILDLEYVILQSLQFTLAVHNGLKALHGFFLDIQAVLGDEADGLGKIHDSARQSIIQGFISNASFFFTPPQIALAALMKENEDILTKYLAQKFDQSQCSSILDILRDCIKDLQDREPCSTEEGKRIDRKLHWCLNPDKYLLKAKRKAESSANTPNEPDAKRLKVESTSGSPTPLPSGSSSVPGSVPPMDPAAN